MEPVVKACLGAEIVDIDPHALWLGKIVIAEDDGTPFARLFEEEQVNPGLHPTERVAWELMNASYGACL